MKTFQAAIVLLTTTAPCWAQNYFETPPVNLTPVQDAVNVLFGAEAGGCIVIGAPGLEINSFVLMSASESFVPSSILLPPSGIVENSPARIVFANPNPGDVIAVALENLFSDHLGFDAIPSDITWGTGSTVAEYGSWDNAPGGGPYLHAAHCVPEPSTAILSCLGFLSLLAWRRTL